MLADGVHPKIVSERLGHASIVLTLDTYSHVLPNMPKDATARLGPSLRLAFDELQTIGEARIIRLESVGITRREDHARDIVF